MQVQLGGTSMRVPRGLQGGRRGDGIDLADDSWQPSKLELQARLGASKERQLELEWRLQQAEQKIAQAQVITLGGDHNVHDTDQEQLQHHAYAFVSISSDSIVCVV